MAAVISDALLDAIMDPQRPAIFFLGAGNSADSNLPSAWDLAQIIRAGLPADHQAAIQDWETQNHMTAQLENIAEICRGIDGDQRQFIDQIPGKQWLDAEPHEGHIVLAQLWAEKLVGEPFTTNLDTLIEKGFQRALLRQLAGCFRVEHFRALPPRVYKVHGCLTEPYDTIWALSDLERKDWDQAWKSFATGREMLESSAFIFVGFRMALPYLLKTYHEAGKPTAFMVNKPTFEQFSQADPQNQAFLQAFNINEAEYVTATSKSFFEELRLRVQERILQKQLCVTVPQLVADLDLPRPDLQAPGEALFSELQHCTPAGLQSLLKRSLLGTTYIGLGHESTAHLLRGLFLLRVAYPIEIETNLAEPICYLLRGNERIPVFFAVGEQIRSKSVVANWQAKANRDWPDDMKPLLLKPPLVVVFGEGAVADPVGLPNIATGRAVPGPYGPEPRFAYLSYHDMVDCIEPHNLVATASGIEGLVEQALGGAKP